MTNTHIHYSLAELFNIWYILKVLKLKVSAKECLLITRLITDNKFNNQLYSAYPKQSIEAAFDVLVYRESAGLKQLNRELHLTERVWSLNKEKEVKELKQQIALVEQRIASLRLLQNKFN